jgi:hypothetical protein
MVFLSDVSNVVVLVSVEISESTQMKAIEVRMIDIDAGVDDADVDSFAVQTL